MGFRASSQIRGPFAKDQQVAELEEVRGGLGFLDQYDRIKFW